MVARTMANVADPPPDARGADLICVDFFSPFLSSSGARHLCGPSFLYGLQWIARRFIYSHDLPSTRTAHHFDRAQLSESNAARLGDCLSAKVENQTAGADAVYRQSKTALEWRLARGL